MKNHKWNKEQREVVLEILYKKYKHIDESEIFELASTSIGTTLGSVKGMYRSFQKISEGVEPSSTKGGFGSMFIQESIDVYNEFMERNNISIREQQTMFR